MKTWNFLAGIAVLTAILTVACTTDPLILYDEQPSENVIGLRSIGDLTVDTIANWKSGNANSECAQAGSDCAYSVKVDPPADGIYYVGSDPEVAINVQFGDDGLEVLWTSDHKVCAVVVKGGPGANVYTIEGGTCSSEGTKYTPPINPNNGLTYAISHVSFCVSPDPCESELETCYEEETAWAFGERYNKKGNWATYTAYPGNGGIANIFAGKTHLAGTVKFIDNGNGTINLSITLGHGFVFYYDLGDPVADNNVKVQDYAKAPSGNPAPGLFKFKENAAFGSTTHVITVPKNNFYGIHLDVAKEVVCDY